MTTLLEIRQKIISIYSQYETYIELALKFLVVLLCLLSINSLVGYQDTMAGTIPTLIITLVCTLIPSNAIAFILALVILLHLYALSLEAAVIGGILFLILLLVYYRFSPKDSMLLFLYPIFRAAGIPYALPIAGGLLYSPASGVTVAVGVIVDTYLRFIHDNETAITSAAEQTSAAGSSGLDTDSLITNVRFLIDGIVQDRGMLIRVIAVAAAAILVYTVRRLPVRYAWTLAAGVGAVVQLIVLLTGAIAYDTGISIGGAFGGTIVSFLIGVVISFFAFNLDYTRIENTQFEDDDYYYYVKAIPKNVLSHPKRTVKTISTRTHGQESTGGRRGTAERYYSDEASDWNTGRIDAIDNLDDGRTEPFEDPASQYDDGGYDDADPGQYDSGSSGYDDNY